nr:UDP-N-acetylmuramoyl-tripeptide--D-alanyl-D-alanine ligase [Bittarella massiliensis (ex Durand et al. 2017)]
MRLQAIAEAIGASYTGELTVSGVSSDTRAIGEGSLFVAIRGERFDGHAFVAQAFEKGAAAAVLSDPAFAVEGRPCLVCPNTLDAMIQIGGLYRSLFSEVRCVGVTGSVGKTTTKEMLYAALSPFGKTLKTEGNQNNEIGMPRTLFQLTDDTRLAVIEMGMSGFGEIEPMTRAVRPEVAVLTNIGVSHLEKLGTRENILAEKLSITRGLQGVRTLVLNEDNDLLSTVERADGARRIIRISLCDRDADIWADALSSDSDCTHFVVHYADGAAYPARIPCLGKHNVYDALLALGAAEAFGLDRATAVAGLQAYQTAGMRQRVKRLAGITVIEDCYNASPDSMRASLALLGQNFGGARKAAVLADMLELGARSAQMHRQVGRDAAAEGIDALFCYGEQARLIAEGAREAGCKEVFSFDEKDQLAEALCRWLAPGDCILVKGSRGMKLEEVLEIVYGAME